jgi:hypothetical protein
VTKRNPYERELEFKDQTETKRVFSDNFDAPNFVRYSGRVWHYYASYGDAGLPAGEIYGATVEINMPKCVSQDEQEAQIRDFLTYVERWFDDRKGSR